MLAEKLKGISSFPGKIRGGKVTNLSHSIHVVLFWYQVMVKDTKGKVTETNHDNTKLYLQLALPRCREPTLKCIL